MYRLTADHGLAESQHNLGYCYQYGIGGLERDDNQAIFWYKLAAAQGLQSAKDVLARLNHR